MNVDIDGPVFKRGEVIRYENAYGQRLQGLVLCRTRDGSRNRYAVAPYPYRPGVVFYLSGTAMERDGNSFSLGKGFPR